MEEANEEKGKGWLVWLLIIPLSMAAGALLTRWALHPGQKAPAAVQAAAPAEPAAPAAPAAAAKPLPPPAADSASFDLPGDEPAPQDTGVVWTKKPAEDKQEARQAPAAPAAPAAAVSPASRKKYKALGFAYGALSKAAEKLLDNPKAAAALFNNDYVVKGFMSRDTVKNATASSASLANYLKNPANLSKFMNKPAVRGGINDQQLVNALAGSKLASALLDTPGGKALLNDPSAIAGIVQANPDIIGVLTNPTIRNAMSQNPRTAGVAGQLAGGGLPQ